MAEIKNNIISLIGMTGCGKSSVGCILAKKIGAVSVDLDDEIVRRYGDIKKIFAERGEAEFRKIEFETLKDTVAASNGALTVLSCGGGLPTYEASGELLSAATTVVWLRRSAESVCADERVLMRPPVNGDIDNYRRLLSVRYPIYKGCAEYSFYNAFPQRTARAIMKKLQLDIKTEVLK